MSKTKANVQYTSKGSDKPAVGEMQRWNGSEWVPTNSANRPIHELFVTNRINVGGEININNQLVIKVLQGGFGFYTIGQGGAQILRARIYSDGDIEAFST